MSLTFKLDVSAATFKRLQGYVVPLIDTADTALNRIFDAYDKTNPKPPSVLTAPPHQAPTHWKSQRGFELPIGLELFADWNGHKLKAKVTPFGIEYKGKPYEVSPSAAAAKKDHGANDTQASTNGWKFWQFKKPDGRTKFIDDFRPQL